MKRWAANNMISRRQDKKCEDNSFVSFKQAEQSGQDAILPKRLPASMMKLFLLEEKQYHQYQNTLHC